MGSKSRVLDHIQILRGISVLLVVLYHYFPKTFPGGFVGVDIFFVISGYVITRSLVSRGEVNLSELAAFYRHRLFRIVPAYLVVGLATLGFGYFYLMPEDLRNLSKHLAAATLFANNLVLYKEVGYFDIGGEIKPLLHFWSLSVEEQFYIVYPVLIILCYKLFTEKVKRFALLGSLCLLSFVYFNYAAEWSPSFSFYMMPARFWELAIGGILYLSGFGLKNDALPNYKIASLTIALLTFSVTKIDASAIQSIVAVLMALVFIGASSCTLNNKEVSSTLFIPFKSLGTISYSLYLTHWPVYSISYILLQGDPSLGTKTFLIVLSVALALLLYFKVERPMIKIGHRVKTVQGYLTKESVVILFLMAATFLLSANIFIKNGFESSSGEKVKELSIAGHWDHLYAHCDRPAGAVFSFERTCISYDKNSHKKFVVLGDSHADHFFIGLATAGVDYGYSAIHAGANGCPPLLGVNRMERPLCLKYLLDVIDKIKADSNIDAVFIAARWAYYIQGITSPGEPVGLARFQDESLSKSLGNTYAVQSGIKKMILELRRHGKRVVVIDQIPEFSIDPRKFYYYRSIELTANEQLFKERRTHIVKNALTSISAKDDGVQYYDPSIFFCRDGSCSNTVNGQMFYRDDDHLNEIGSKYIGRKIFETFMK